MNVLRTALLWLAVVAATLAPILTAQVPPGADMPNHIARAHILAHLAGDTDLQRYYEPAWQVLPNLAADGIMLALMPFMDAYAAGKSTLVLAVLLLFAGTALLRRAVTGRVGLMPLGAALFVYSPLLALGLVNFLIGAGLVLVATALWLMGRRWPWPAHLAVASGLATLVFLAHALALAAYGLIVAALRLGQWRHCDRPSWREDGVLAASFAVPAALWLMVKASTHGGLTRFGGWRERLDALIAPSSYFQDSDLAVAAGLAVLAAWLLWTGRLKAAPALRWPLLALVAVALVMPQQLLGVWLTHIRLPVIAALMFLAAAEVRLPDRKLLTAVVAALAVFGAVRLATVERAVAHCDAKRQEMQSALATLPKAPRILPVITPDAVVGDCLFSNYWHMPALAVIDKSALFPLIFVNMQPLALAPDVRHLSRHQQRALFSDELSGRPRDAWGRMIAEGWRRDFDHLVWMYPGTTPPAASAGVDAVASGSFFTIYRIVP